MPIFEYRCTKCQRQFEQLVLGSRAENGITCPKCRSHEVEKIYSTFYGRSRTRNSAVHSLLSGCSSCQATSCAGCKIR